MVTGGHPRPAELAWQRLSVSGLSVQLGAELLMPPAEVGPRIGEP